MGLKAGIDLGTTNSCIYVLLGEKWVVVPIENNRPTAPSAVWKHKGVLKVGRSARAMIGQSPGPILEIKRLMGTDSTVELDGEQKTPVEVSALILRYLKEVAEVFVQKQHPQHAAPITDVVITHPAYFGAAATTATAEAGRLAGFTTVDLLAEPIAAALAYTQRVAAQGATGDHKILAYDLGGGTFDVTVLEQRAADGIIHVLEYGGEAWLGGSNFDSRLAEYLRQQLVKAGYALDNLDAKNPADAVRIAKLKSEAEALKIQLTSRDTVDIATPNFMTDKENQVVDLSLSLSREEFNTLTKDLMDQSLRLTHRILAKQSFSDGRRLTDQELDQWADEQVRQREAQGRRLNAAEREQYRLDAIRARSRANAQFCEVIMAGSSCWMPVVKERLEAELERSAQLVDPGVIVAEGAVIKIASTAPGALVLPTQDQRISLLLSYPPKANRTRQVPISGALQGEASGCTVTLCDGDTGKPEPRRLDQRLDFLFQRDIDKERDNEFTLQVQNPAGEEILEYPFTIRYDSGGSSPPPTLTKSILVQTRSGFEILFAKHSQLPIKGEMELLTPNDSGLFRIPFYEEETYMDEIIVRNAPQQKGLSFVLRAEMNKDRQVKAEAVIAGTEKPPSVEFEIRGRPVRSIDEILKDWDLLKSRFANHLVNVKKENKKLQFSRRRAQLEQEKEQALKSLSPEPGHLEDLAAQFRKLVEEVAMVPQLTPSYEALKTEMAARVPYAPSGSDKETLDTFLRDAEKAWEAQDEDKWNELVKQCREHTRGWKPPPLPPRPGGDRPPPPAEVRQDDLAWLEKMRKEVKAWPDTAAKEREAVLADIAEAERKVGSAPEEAASSVHNTEVYPLGKRVEAGPQGVKPGEIEVVDTKK